MDSKNIVSVDFLLTLFGSLCFGPLATSFLSLVFSMTFRSPSDNMAMLFIAKLGFLTLASLWIREIIRNIQI